MQGASGAGHKCSGGVVVLVRRTGRRRLSREFEETIVGLVQGRDDAPQQQQPARHHPAAKAARGSWCGLRVVVYDADVGQTPGAVLALFAGAVAVVAPHGAGLSNLIAAPRGLHVLEFHPSQPDHPASGLPGLNLCMLHLARALGLRYTGALMWPVDEQDRDTGEVGTAWAGDVSVLEAWVHALHRTACATGDAG